MKIGTTVRMINCYEGEYHRGKVWTTKSRVWKLPHGEEVVLLENYSGAFSVNCLEVVL